jgi:uncharacterized protein YceH (UPF0502 family)
LGWSACFSTSSVAVRSSSKLVLKRPSTRKARTVPDSYPLSLNSLALGCNQKTTRDPVMNLSEAEVLDALNNLKEHQLVREASGSRVTRFEHNFQRGIGVPEQSAVLLGMLMLRGPQTTAELRLEAEVAQLRPAVAKLCAEPGVTPDTGVD